MKRASQPTQGRCATVASRLIDAILVAASAAGVADSAQLAVLRTGVSMRSAGAQKSGRVQETSLLWLWGELADLGGGHRVGVELARFAGTGGYGVLSEAVTHAASLADAFGHVARYARLVHQGVTVEVETEDSFFVLRYRRSGSDPRPSSGAVAAGTLWANARLALLPELVFNVRLRPVSAELACVPIDDARGVVTDIFGTDVKFGTASWRLVFERSAVRAVSRPVASSALEYLEAYADRALGDIPAFHDVVGMVAAEIRGRLGGRVPTVDEIARALGLSTRTLQRRLAVAGSGFEAVLDEMRRACAEALLADGGGNLAEIAYKLGYSELSAFTRAATRWFNVPPSRLR